MRRLMQPLWVLLALIFLAEAWLWEKLEPIVARVVAWIPLRAIKAWLAARVAHLSPAASLIVFLVPAVLLFPLKVIAVWLFAHHAWMSGCAVLAFGKLVGVGAAAFIFDVTRPKLMQMGWFAQLYQLVVYVREWARTMVAPVRIWFADMRAQLVGTAAPRWVRRLKRTRRRMLAVR